MSYSRWGNSTWYTFWHTGSGHTRDTQYFEICAIKTFTYKELKNDLEGCLNKVRREDLKATEEEIMELHGYIKEFINDVENDRSLLLYEKLQNGIIEDINEFAKWVNSLNDKELKEEISEALKILYADKEDLPLLVDVETDLGKMLLEKRLKEIILQLRKESLMASITTR